MMKKIIWITFSNYFNWHYRNEDFIYERDIVSIIFGFLSSRLKVLIFQSEYYPLIHLDVVKLYQIQFQLRA